MDREIPDQHAALLRQMCSTPWGEPLAKKVVDLYWANRVVADRVSYALAMGDLMRICVECAFGKPTAKEIAGPGVVALWRNRKIKSGQAVTILWRNEKVPGRLLRVTNDDQCRVMIGSDPEEYTVGADQVTIAA